MSGNTNTTVAYPGHDNWSVWWWNGLESFQLDIVGFLAVLGESAVLANAQVAALSRLFLLPRILPAPQALIRTTRVTSLQGASGKVTGVYSGNVREHVHHVANILLGKEMTKYDVRCVTVTEKERNKQGWIDLILYGRARAKPSPGNKSKGPSPSLVRAEASGPLTWVTLIGFAEALTLFIASIVFGDGMSVIATILLAGLSTVVGICNKWTLKLPQTLSGDREIPKGDVVIRYPNGSFLVVKCNEHVARELYFAPEEIDYAITSDIAYRLLSLAGTLMLMLGIVALANAKLWLQVAWAGAYIITNIAHWIAAALPQSSHWDLTCYSIAEEGLSTGPSNTCFTEALWKAIVLTQSLDWVGPGTAAPQTQVWKNWLHDALKAAREDEGAGESKVRMLEEPFWGEPKKGTVWTVPKWNAKAEWDRITKETNSEPFRKA